MNFGKAYICEQLNENLKEFIAIYDIKRKKFKFLSNNFERLINSNKVRGIKELFSSILTKEEALKVEERLLERIENYRDKDRSYTTIYDCSSHNINNINTSMKEVEIHSKIVEKDKNFDIIFNIVDISPYNLKLKILQREIERLRIVERDLKASKKHLINQNQQLVDVANRDELTGLYNRYYFNKVLDQELERHDRYQNPITLISFDIDDFKKVNDDHGHLTGDDVLMRIAKHIQSTISPPDILARWGGEEFSILLPQSSLTEGYMCANRLCSALNNIEHPNVGRVTASFGVAQKLPNESMEQWFGKVDQLLYKAKTKGKNRVEKDLLSDTSTYLFKEWNQAWNSGHKAIDIQHKYLLYLMNNLSQKFFRNSSNKVLEETVILIIKHVEYHFEYEENLMKRSGFPHLEKHKESHKEILEELKKLLEILTSNKVQYTKFITFILEKVVEDHMIHEDMFFFPYIKFVF